MNDRLWPKADIRTKSKSGILNGCFGEKSGHPALEPGLIRADLTGLWAIHRPELGRISPEIDARSKGDAWPRYGVS